MTFSAHRISSVTRWLLVVVGCAILEMAQPTKAATAEGPVDPAAAVTAPADGQRAADTLLIPGGSPRPVSAERPAPGGSTSWLLVLGLCASGAAWFWWRKRGGEAAFGRPARLRKIQIEESRALGNRQYLVLASVEGKRLLLGVTSGSIQLLTAVEQEEEAAGDFEQ